MDARPRGAAAFRGVARAHAPARCDARGRDELVGLGGPARHALPHPGSRCAFRMTAIGLMPRMRWWWRWRGHLATGRPAGRAENAVLRTLAEREASVAEVERLGLPLYDDRPKNWDSLVALHAIL